MMFSLVHYIQFFREWGDHIRRFNLNEHTLRRNYLQKITEIIGNIRISTQY